MRVKKLTKGVSDQMNRPARRSAMKIKVYLACPTVKDAAKVKPNVPATIIFSARFGNNRFIATLEARETASSAMPVFVKYNSASSPLMSPERIEVYASRTADVLVADAVSRVRDFCGAFLRRVSSRLAISSPLSVSFKRTVTQLWSKSADAKLMWVAHGTEGISLHIRL